MSEYVLEGVSTLLVGEKTLRKVNGKSILVYRLSDGYFATSSKCTHLFKSLEKAKIIDDKTVQCPLHRAEFDIRSGEVSQWANFPPGIQLVNALRKEKCLSSYPVTEKNGEFFVSL